MRALRIGMWLLAACLLMACGGGPKEGERRVVSVTIEPQRYFAERVAGDRFAINCVVPEGQSPETYDPTPRQMAQVGESEAYLRVGSIGFERAWMENIAANNPSLRIFNLSDGIQPLPSPEIHEEAKGEETDHYHGDTDPHTWSSVSGAKVIARNTLDALVAIDPAGKANYEANYRSLAAEIDSVGQVIDSLVKPLRHRIFIIYHPALTYFAAEQGLTQLCIEMDGKEPSPAQMRELVDAARSHDVRVVFVQREFDQKNAELIAKETGCRLVAINPLSRDWSGEMMRIAKALADGEAD